MLWNCVEYRFILYRDEITSMVATHITFKNSETFPWPNKYKMSDLVAATSRCIAVLSTCSLRWISFPNNFTYLIKENIVEITVIPEVSFSLQWCYVNFVTLFQFFLTLLQNVSFPWLKLQFPHLEEIFARSFPDPWQSWRQVIPQGFIWFLQLIVSETHFYRKTNCNLCATVKDVA